jgi:hypothetical protein
MRIVNKEIVSLALAIFVFFSTGSYAANYNLEAELKVKEAFKIVVNGTGDLTSNEYSEFWKLMPYKNESERQELIKFLKENYVDIMLYQAEVWACADKAWETQKVIKCDLAIAYENNMNMIFRRKGLDISQLKKGQSHSRQLWKAASERTGFKSNDGQVVDLSHEMIIQVRASLENTFKRYSQALK